MGGSTRKNNTDGTYLIDSVASPSLLTNVPQDVNHKPTHVPVHTANGDVVATEEGPVSLKREANPSVKINALGMPKLCRNLLCVSDIVRKQRPLVFTSDGAYGFPLKLFTILNLRQKVAKCKNGLYVVNARITSPDEDSDLAYSNNTISSTLHTSMKNRTHAPVPELLQITKKVRATQPTTVRSGNRTGSQNELKLQPTEMVCDGKDFQPPFGISRDTRTARLFNWHLKLNHAHTDAIWATLKLHSHPDTVKLSSAVITCTDFDKGKLTRGPHRRTKHTASPGTVL